MDKLPARTVRSGVQKGEGRVDKILLCCTDGEHLLHNVQCLWTDSVRVNYGESDSWVTPH